MAKKVRGTQRRSQTEDRPPTLSEEELVHTSGIITVCQRVLHALTGVMIGAFALIVLFTTISSGPFVQMTGRGLYFLILASAATSLATWIVRVRMEKRMGNETLAVSDLLRRS
jgi:hypothetical protein